MTVVLTTHYMEEAERLADRIHIIDRGRLIASGSPLELTRGGTMSTIRLVVTQPFPPGAPESLEAALGAGIEVDLLDELSLLVTGPADASTLAKVSRWCEENDVLPESLTLGTAHPRGRLPRADRAGAGSGDAPSPRARGRAAARRSWRRPGWRRGCCCATASSCCSPW